MSGKIATLILATAVLLAPATGAQQATNPPPAAALVSTNRDAVLQFFDGSILHGAVAGMDQNAGVQWKHPAAKAALKLAPSNLASIRFETTQTEVLQARPNSRFRFKNGDDVFGDLKQITGSAVNFETWFGSNLNATRDAVHSIEFSRKGFGTLYEGPTSAAGWKLGNGPKPWTYKDGAFISNGPDALGRDMGLTGSSRIEFDLAWVGSFSMSVTMYTENVARFDYGSSAYMFYIGPGSITLQRVQAGAGVMLLGQAQVPSMFRRNKMRLEFRVNKEEGVIAAYADGQLLQRWKDQNGFVAKGTGLVFFTQMDGPSVKLSNLKVSEWDGRFESETPPDTKQDVLYLANRDKMIGELQGVAEGKVSFKAGETQLQVPIERVTQIVFAPAATNVAPAQPWEVRAHFSAGETVSLSLDQFNDQQFMGSSRNFGNVTFKPEAVREIQFNLDKHRAAEGAVAPADEFLDLE